jgi:hypothetical protein
MTSRKPGIYAGAAVVITVLCLLGFMTGELAFRLIDGYELWSPKLVRQGPVGLPTVRTAASYAASIPLAPGMKQEWFDLSPNGPPRRPPPRSLVMAVERYSVADVHTEAIRVFNSGFARARLCSHSLLKRFPGFIFLYDAPNGVEYPRYRFPLDVTTPSGLTTNRFGWRGPDIALRKPERTIRIAFVGASTTLNNHEFPLSYPELAGFWLNRWAEEKFGIRVEIINAGREGIASADIAAVVRDEVLPLEPDLVVYYEGGNQFKPASIVRMHGDPGPAPAAPQGPLGTDTFWQQHSAAARRIAQVTGLFGGDPAAEPSKPSYEVVWPPDISEQDPPLDHPALPSELSTIIGDLDAIKATLATHGTELALGSYVWMVFDGMKLDPVRHALQLYYLNTVWYPYRYREMERLAAFQNRVFKKYAAARDILFLDFAAKMPRDPDLFQDAVHASYDGVRLQAWITAQELASVLERRIQARQLPRPMQSAIDRHPAFPGNQHTMVFDCNVDWNESIRLKSFHIGSGLKPVPPATVQAEDPAVETGKVVTVRVPANTPAYHYAALVPLPAVERQEGSDFLLTLEIKVSGGEAGVGIPFRDQKGFRAHQVIAETAGFVPLRLLIETSDTEFGQLVIAAGGRSSPNPITIELRNAEIRSIVGPMRKFRVYARDLAVPPAR